MFTMTMPEKPIKSEEKMYQSDTARKIVLPNTLKRVSSSDIDSCASNEGSKLHIKNLHQQKKADVVAQTEILN